MGVPFKILHHKTYKILFYDYKKNKIPNCYLFMSGNILAQYFKKDYKLNSKIYKKLLLSHKIKFYFMRYMIQNSKDFWLQKINLVNFLRSII